MERHGLSVELQRPGNGARGDDLLNGAGMQPQPSSAGSHLGSIMASLPSRAEAEGTRTPTGRTSKAVASPVAGVRHKAAFPNGDKYEGGWLEGKPHGLGRYTWADGSWFEGQWERGEKHGEGEYHWVDGTVYVGDWQHNRMNGIGVYTTPEGSRYEGSMLEDRRHGLGRMEYCNGDSYEGLWKEGRPHGPGRYRWDTGNEYDGEWVDGRMQGRGTFVWRGGERYDGEWLEGREHGFGMFQWPNSATFQGTWTAGKKAGVGIYVPAADVAAVGSPPGGPVSDPAAPPRGPDWPAHAADPAGRLPGRESSRNEPVAPAGDRPLVIGHRRMTEDDRLESSFNAGPSREPPSVSGEGRPVSEWIVVREYEGDKLVREARVPSKALKKVYGVKTKERRKVARFGAGAVTRVGETIYKGHRSYDLMVSLQLGIRYSVGLGGMGRDGVVLSDSAFTQKVKQLFPRSGSARTPPHAGRDFVWKDYAPDVFRKLRRAFGLDPGDFMLSICGDKSLRELSSPGKSGSVFYITHDDSFILKTVQKNECKILMEVLPRYYAHMQRYPDSLLTKFYGLYRIDTGVGSGRRVRFVVMGNIFKTDLEVHQTYDLKGSIHGRYTHASKGPAVALKDLDLTCSLKLETHWRDKLLHQLKVDTEFLSESGIMDYSLLVGIHTRSRTSAEKKGLIRPLPANMVSQTFDEESTDQEATTEDEDQPSPRADRPPTRGSALEGVPEGGGRLPRPSAPANASAREGKTVTFCDSMGAAAQQQPAASASPTPPGGATPPGASIGLQNGSHAYSGHGPRGSSNAPQGSEDIGTRGSSIGAGGASAEQAARMRRARPANLMVQPAPSMRESPLGTPLNGAPPPGQSYPNTPGASVDPTGQLLLGKLADQGWYREKINGQSRLAHRGHTTQRGALQAAPQLPPRSALTRTTTFRPQGTASTDYLNLALGRVRVRLGSNMAATAVRIQPVSPLAYKRPPAVPLRPSGSLTEQDAEDVVLYLGIIDILQHYRLAKRLEHTFKSMAFDARGVSVTHPDTYAARFMAFMQSVFC